MMIRLVTIVLHIEKNSKYGLCSLVLGGCGDG